MKYFNVKRILVNAVVTPLISLSFLAASSALVSAKPKEVRISVPGPEKALPVRGLYIFKEYVEKSFPGEFDVQIFPSSTLFKQNQNAAALARGNVEMTFLAPAVMAQNVPEASVLATGFLIRNPAHACEIMKSDFGKKLNDSLASKMNARSLAIFTQGKRTLALRKARDVNSPEDMKGLTIRQPGAKTWQLIGTALGGNPTPIPFGELYLALQTGTVDAYAFDLPTMITAKFNEATEQVVETYHLENIISLVINDKFFGELTDNQRAVFSEAASAATSFMNDNLARIEKQAKDTLAAGGIKFTQPDIEAFKAKMFETFKNSDVSDSWAPNLLEDLSALQAGPNC